MASVLKLFKLLPKRLPIALGGWHDGSTNVLLVTQRILFDFVRPTVVAVRKSLQEIDRAFPNEQNETNPHTESRDVSVNITQFEGFASAKPRDIRGYLKMSEETHSAEFALCHLRAIELRAENCQNRVIACKEHFHYRSL